MFKPFSQNPSAIEIDEVHRKRHIDEVADPQAQPNSSRLRVTHKPTVESDDSSDYVQEGYQYYSESEAISTSAGEEESDNGNTRKSSFEHKGDNVVDPIPTVVKREDNGSYPAPRGTLQFWEEASTMDSKGRNWDEIGITRKEDTGQETPCVVILNTYDRPHLNAQILEERDSERLLTAVEEIQALFRREEWQLVKNAMIRAGAAEYSKGFLQKQYQKLARDLRTTKTLGSQTENYKGLVSIEESPLTNGATVAGLSPVKPMHTPLRLRLIETVHTRTHPSPLGTTSSRVGSATNSEPARLTASHKATNDDTTRKQNNDLNPSSDPAKSGPGMPSIVAPSRLFGILVNEETLQCTKVQQRTAVQRNPSAENGFPQIESRPERAPNLFGLSVGEAPSKPLPYHKPSDIQARLQREGTQQQSPNQPFEAEPKLEAATSDNVVGAFSPHGKLSEVRKDQVTTDQLMDMVKYRNLNEANQSKAWDDVAHECGLTATLADIAVAFEQAGFPRLISTLETLRSAENAAIPSLTKFDTRVSSQAPAPRNQTPPGTGVAAAPARAFETPDPAIIPGKDGTPSTRSRRGRPPGSRNKSKFEYRGGESSMSPSQTQLPASGQKCHVRSAEAKAAQSAAMKAAWKRRKEKGTNGRQVGSPMPSTTAGQSFVDRSTATFAADILTAAAAITKAASSFEPRFTKTSTPPIKPDPLEDEPADLLTGESVFAQHYDDPPPAPHPGPPPAKRIVRRSIASRPM